MRPATRALRKIQNTADKVDSQKAIAQDWRTDFKVRFSDITEGNGHRHDVIEAIDAIIDAALNSR